MKIGFVAEPYEEKNASGMGHVVLELIKNLLEQDKENEFIIFSSVNFNEERLIGNSKNILIPKSFLKKLLWFGFSLKNIDLLVFVVPLLPLIIFKKIKTLLVCQELASQKIKPKKILEKIKSIIRDRIMMPITLKKSSVVVAASNATSEDLLKFYNIKTEKIKIIYDGFQDLSIFKDREIKIEGRMEPYFFFAGKVKYRKNVHGIVDGFIKFKKKTKSDCKLIIAGEYGGDYYRNLINKLEENNLLNDVFFIGYITKEKLYSFYKNATACVFSSINEGFGMPIAEAMSLGIPVITSNISSMKEVAGEAGLLVDPFNTNEIARAMEKIFFDKKLREELIKKGLERSKLFSWQKAAQEYLNLIKSL
ncbi:MAG: glycosyltransferase family 1 protein [Patescibacteria group bacterium]